MLRDEVLKHPTRVLTETQRAAFFAKGYLTLPNYVPSAGSPGCAPRWPS